MPATRKLAAILVADVAGYSRLANADEDRTLARLRALRSDLVDPTVGVHGGRIVKRTGDGLVAEFRSAVEAVKCAVEIQQGMAERNTGVLPERRIDMRIGVNVGDVVEEADGDLMGDVVNIAARLEAACAPGAVCLSEDAYRQVRQRLPFDFHELGPLRLKNIAEPVRAYLIEGKLGTIEAKEAGRAPSLPLPDRPSIAVLPFQNMSAEPEQDYLADGIVEDIITGLSRIRWIFVTARNSSFTYKGRAVDVRQVGRELGVRYVLEGSVRRSGSRLRITAQLIEADTRAHLWAERFDGAMEDVFDLQDDITERVVGVIEPSLRRHEIERSRRKRPDSLDAYDLYLRALPHMARMTPLEVRSGAEYLERALKLEPDYAAAHAMLGLSHEIRFGQGEFEETERAAGLAHARAAIGSETDDAGALAVAALVVAHLDRDFATASHAIDRALRINPACTTALFFAAHIASFRGDFEPAEEHAWKALRLSPFDPWAYEAHVALAMRPLAAGQFDEASAHLSRAVQANPNFPSPRFLYAMTLALSGRLEESRRELSAALQKSPATKVRLLREIGLLPSLADKLAEGARAAGMPE